MAVIGKDIARAVALLEEGALVAIPTETVYGLAANALDPVAVSRIFEVKNRPRFDPLILHVSDIENIQGLVAEFPDAARRLAECCMPGPLTLLLPKSERVADIVTAGSSRVAVRIPRHPMTLEVLRLAGFPLAAPSANPFGYISPTTANHVEAQLGEQIPYILDGGACEVGVESTIVGWDEQGDMVVYRKGGIPIEEIRKLVGPVKVLPHSVSRPDAPGMLVSHYAPRVPMVIGNIPELLEQYATKQVGVIAFRDTYPMVPSSRQVALSKRGDFAEAARRLFAGMRALDRLGLDVILAELVPEEGLGRAINDRLRRAAAQEWDEKIA